MTLRVLVFLVLFGSVAHANGVVLESYTGDRPKDASRLLAPILGELSKRKYDAGDGVARLYDAKVSKAAIDAQGMPPDFSAKVDAGFKAWVNGQFDQAVKQLVPLVDTAHANSGEFAKNPGLRDPLLKGLTALAIAYQRIGDLGSMQATFKEIIRAFPDATVARGKYGADAATAFEQVQKDVQAGGKGKLVVKLTDDTAVVFVDEAYRAAGSTTVEVVPGEYRVVAMLNKRPSRTHVVSVPANGEVTVEIDPKLDQAVQTVGYTGLKFVTDKEREDNEAEFASKFATGINADAVAVVGIDTVRGHSAVVGSLVSLQSGKEIRRASIPLDPDPSTDRLRSLASFLGGDEPAPGLDVQFAKPDTGGKKDNDGTITDHTIEDPRSDGEGGGGGGRWGGWRFVTGGLAVVGLGVGATLVALDGKCSKEPPAGMTCNDLYSTATPGYASLAAGAVFAGVSIYLFATQSSSGHHSSSVSFVAPTRGGAIAGYSLSF